jgi:hypothetical protein
LCSFILLVRAIWLSITNYLSLQDFPGVNPSMSFSFAIYMYICILYIWSNLPHLGALHVPGSLPGWTFVQLDFDIMFKCKCCKLRTSKKKRAQIRLLILIVFVGDVKVHLNVHFWNLKQVNLLRHQMQREHAQIMKITNVCYPISAFAQTYLIIELKLTVLSCLNVNVANWEQVQRKGLK